MTLTGPALRQREASAPAPGRRAPARERERGELRSALARLAAVRLGVRARITLSFALGALVLSALLAVATYLATQGNLLRQRESSALRQASVNARVLRESLKTANADVRAVLTSLRDEAGSQPVLMYGGQWYSTSVDASVDQLPPGLRDRVISGVPARMRYAPEGEPQLAVGVPIPAVGAAYFEIQSLEGLEDTLRALAASLAGAAALTTGLGALLGVWAGGRALRPLAATADAAAAIAAGELGTRLPPVDDPDLGRLATAFNEMVDALQARIDRDARFASDVSHELRSPLMTLAASAEVLQSRRSELPERSAAALDLLVADVDRFQKLVQDLLEISRFDAGAARLELEEVRIGEFLLHAVAAVGGPEVPVALDADLADAVAAVDKRRLAQVLANLLDNARSHAGGVARVSLVRVDDRVRVMVDDSGPGVPEAERQLIFERFARGGAAGRRSTAGGVGLGLALVAEHVHLHGGSVWATDAPGGGARFVVELPLERDADVAGDEDLA